MPGFKKITLLPLLLIYQLLFAQSENLKFDQIGLEQGLSQSTVYAIVQDAQGFMWFGTQDGLNRYDGYSLKVFKHDPNNSNSLSDNTIWSLMCDSRGDLWIGTERGGLNRYVPSENKFYHYMNKENDPGSLSGNFIISLFEDHQGNILVGTHSKGLNLLNRKNGSFRHLSFEKSNSITKICEDKNGSIWVATLQGLYKLKPDELNQSSVPHFIRYGHTSENPKSLSNSNIRTLFFDPQGTLWIGTSGGGLNCFDHKTESFTSSMHNTKNIKSISGNLVTSICGDPSKPETGLWVGTYDGGLNLYDTRTNSFYNYIRNETVISLYHDRSGILWIGTLSGGVKIFDRQKNQFVHYYDNPDNQKDLFGNMVCGILEDRDGELWVASLGYGLNRFDSQRKVITVYTHDPKNDHTLSSNLIIALSESSDGSIWVGTMSGGVNRFDKKNNRLTLYKNDSKNSNSLLHNLVSALYFDEQANTLWIGYSVGGVSKYDLSKNVFEHFTHDEKNPYSVSDGAVSVIYRGKQSGLWIGTIDKGLNRFDKGKFKLYQIQRPLPSLNNNGIQAIYEDDKGIIWIGTYGGGLNRYDPKTDSYIYYTEKNGLPSNVIYSIIPDKSGNLWFSTNKGLSQFNPKNETFRNYDGSDGLQSNEFNQGAAYVGSNGELFFGGVNGFNSFFPGQIENNKYIPPVYLTTFKVFDEVLPLPSPLPANSRIELSYSQNFFSFEFVALNYTASEKNMYAYILEGFDKNWHTASSERRYVSYTNLDPGEYVLHIKGSNNNDIWNEKGTLCTIIIEPPFWKTLWFRLLLGITAIILVIVSYNYRVYKIRKLDLMRLRIARDLHDEVGSDLGGIGLISQRLEKHKELPYDIKTDLSEISRASLQTSEKLRDIVWFVNPEHDNSEHFVIRLKDLAGTLLRDQEYKFYVDSKITFQKFDLEARRQLYLIIKEVLHNIRQHADAKNVDIRLEQDTQRLKITVSDDGRGFEYPVQSKGMGLKNILRRAQQIKGKVEIKSKAGCGTIVVLSVRIP